MEKRALIAVVISLIILVLYQEVVLKYVYPPVEVQETSEEPPVPPPASEPAPDQIPDVVAAAPAPPPHAEERRIGVDTDVFTATFTTTGGRLQSFRIKNLRATVDPNSPPQETVVPGQGGELPFGVELRGPSGQVISDAGVPYTVQSDNLDLKNGESASLDFLWRGEAVTVHKRFTFHADHHEFELAVEIPQAPKEYNEVGVSWVKVVDVPPQPGSEVVFDRALYLDGHKLIETTFDKLSGGQTITGDIGWAGYAGRHFLATAIPTQAYKQRLWLKLRDHTVEEKLLFPIVAGAPPLALEIYIGSKDFDALEKVGHGLSRAVNLGWFGFIAVPLLHILKLSHSFTGNYGVDIILLTVLIKVLFIPLTQRSFRSMREMQKLQPQMAKIRERFKDNSEQMNKEIMELYRRHKVNPLGGCLPMILQIPVFIGLYSALSNAVELRHAPFLFWIHDLSAPDRLGAIQLPFVQHPGVPVLTLLMGVSMFVQQWMSPSAGDPQQQRVMMIMPLMFTFMFVNFPAGLALYWLVNNVLTIAQQYYINRTAT